MICKLDQDNYCERHKTHHRGHYAAYAVDPGEKGQKFRALWDKQANLVKPILRSLPLAKLCTHNTGENGREKAGCTTCTTYGCNVKGTVRLKDCVYCEDWKQHEDTIPLTMFGEMARWQKLWPTNTTIRHLLYHIYPVSNGHWRWNVEQLCGRLKAFNGHRIVAIAVDPPTGRLPDPTGPHAPDRGRHIPGCDSVEEVKAEFAKRWSGDPITFMEFENDPSLREVKTFIPMLEQVLTDDPNHITLYAQAKGTTRHAGHIARRWTEALYEIMMDHFPLAEEQLKEYPVTGCFKKLGPGWSQEQSHSDWHYSGSWFWFKNAALSKRDYWKIDYFWSGIEPYPSQQFKAVEAGCMFHTERVPEMNLYSQRYWRQKVMPAFNQWREENAKYRTEMWPK